MSVRFDADGEALRRTGTANVLNFNQPYTLMAWIRPVASIIHSIWLGLQVSNWVNSDYYRRPNGAAYSQLSVYQGGGGTSIAGSNFKAADWNHFAMVRESDTVLKGYQDGVLDITASHSTVSGRAVSNDLSFGDFYNDANVRFDGRVMAIKAWTVALTAAQVAAELPTIRPQRLDNIWAWWPCFPGSGERIRDYSGNGRHFTEVGTLSDEDPPPVGWAVLPGGGALMAGGPLLAAPPRRTLVGVGT
jgi:hypothetical protein